MGILYFIGLGIHDIRDVPVKALDVIRTAKYVYAEFYTSILGGSTSTEMERFLETPIIILPREDVEEGSRVLRSASSGDTVFLTAGDPMSATTHQSLRIDAMRMGINVKIIHSSSVFTAVPGLLGLPPYKFGRTTTLARPEKGFFPTSPYNVIQQNLELGLHTLILLDIKAHQDYFMSASEGLRLLLTMEEKEKKGILDPDHEVAVVARAGSPDPNIWVGSIHQGMNMDFGAPLHTIVIPGDCHFMEREMLDLLRSGSV